MMGSLIPTHRIVVAMHRNNLHPRCTEVKWYFDLVYFDILCYLVCMDTKKQPTKAVLLRIPEKVHSWVQAEAEATGLTVTGMYRVLIMESKKRRAARAK